MKTLCPIHRLFYTGNECPICRQERSERYAQRFVSHTYSVASCNTVKDDINREITENDIDMLINKFNSKRK